MTRRLPLSAFAKPFIPRRLRGRNPFSRWRKAENKDAEGTPDATLASISAVERFSDVGDSRYGSSDDTDEELAQEGNTSAEKDSYDGIAHSEVDSSNNAGYDNSNNKGNETVHASVGMPPDREGQQASNDETKTPSTPLTPKVVTVGPRLVLR